MYVIMNSEGNYFAGNSFGVNIFKSYWVNANMYDTQALAEFDIHDLGLSNSFCTVQVIDTEKGNTL